MKRIAHASRPARNDRESIVAYIKAEAEHVRGDGDRIDPSDLLDRLARAIELQRDVDGDYMWEPMDGDEL